MERNINGLIVRQESKTGMFNVNDFEKVANEHRKDEGLQKKFLGNFWANESSNELIDTICIEENLSIDEVKKSTRGANGGTWVHPILFAKLAMWFSPKFEYMALNWVMDGLLQTRNDSGDSFKKMMAVLTKEFPKEMVNPLNYSAVANQIANACRVGTSRDKWQKATQDQLVLRDEIQDIAIMIADMSPNAGTCVNTAINKALKKRGF